VGFGLWAWAGLDPQWAVVAAGAVDAVPAHFINGRDSFALPRAASSNGPTSNQKTSRRLEGLFDSKHPFRAAFVGPQGDAVEVRAMVLSDDGPADFLNVRLARKESEKPQIQFTLSQAKLDQIQKELGPHFAKAARLRNLILPEAEAQDLAIQYVLLREYLFQVHQLDEGQLEKAGLSSIENGAVVKSIKAAAGLPLSAEELVNASAQALTQEGQGDAAAAVETQFEESQQTPLRNFSFKQRLWAEGLGDVKGQLIDPHFRNPVRIKLNYGAVDIYPGQDLPNQTIRELLRSSDPLKPQTALKETTRIKSQMEKRTNAWVGTADNLDPAQHLLLGAQNSFVVVNQNVMPNFKKMGDFFNATRRAKVQEGNSPQVLISPLMTQDSFEETLAAARAQGDAAAEFIQTALDQNELVLLFTAAPTPIFPYCAPSHK